MIPAKTFDVVGGTTIAGAKRFDPNGYYLLTGTDLNDLAVLAIRFNYAFKDPDETRDWQNRVSLMLSSAIEQTLQWDEV